MIKIVLDDKYEYAGGIGCWVRSFENNIDIGTVRMIGDKLMKATYKYKKFWKKDEICWTPVEDINSYDSLREWIKSKV